MIDAKDLQPEQVIAMIQYCYERFEQQDQQITSLTERLEQATTLLAALTMRAKERV